MNGIGLTPQLVMELIEAGLSNNQIAAATGKSRQYISKYVRNRGLRKPTPRQVALKHYPWKTGERFHESMINRSMRDLAEYYATGGEGMAQWKRERLRRFLDYLKEEDVVVEFDPSIPGLDPDEIPRGGTYDGRHGQTRGDSVGGFAFRPRKTSDGDLIIRVNQHTRLTPQGALIWRFPPELP